MGKRGKKRGARPAVAAAPSPAVEARPRPSPAPVALPAARARGGVPGQGFWQGFEIPWAKLVTFRFVFFALLAIDAYLQLRHAPRYGAGGFNVQQLPGAPLPEPGRASVTFLHASLCVMFALIAQGALVRVLLPLAAAAYGYVYFSSQLDSYQHHYLVWLLLVLLCFVPRRPDPVPAGASPQAPRFVRSWALRLVLVQLAIVYFYAAVAKMDPLWLDGTTLSRQVKPGWVRDLLTGIGWYPVAILVMAGELALAVTVWWRKAWPVALVLGVGLHVGIELVGLEIGLFSYLMFGAYLLVAPDRVYLEGARLARALAARWHALPLVARIVPPALVTVFALGYLMDRAPLVSGVIVAGLVVGLVIAEVTTRDVRTRVRRLAIVGLAAAVPALTDASTDVSADHYRYWAGAARRLGDEAGAREAYQGLLAVDPSSEYAHYWLGEQASKDGKLDAALAHYRAAQRSRPDRARAYLGEALVRLRQSDKAAARTALERAVSLEPGNTQARELLGSISADHPSEAMTPGGGAAPAPPTDPDVDP